MKFIRVQKITSNHYGQSVVDWSFEFLTCFGYQKLSEKKTRVKSEGFPSKIRVNFGAFFLPFVQNTKMILQSLTGVSYFGNVSDMFLISETRSKVKESKEKYI